MITTGGMLIRALRDFEDDFLTVYIDEKEYIIENITHVKDYTDSPHSHIMLKVRDGGDGNIKR